MGAIGMVEASRRVLCGAVLLAAAVGSAGPAAAQRVAPSLYLGLGTGTNVGGTAGVGLEVRVGRRLAASAAVGLWPEALRTAGTAAFDVDVGLKVYPTGRWVFAGLNYGIIHAEIATPEAARAPVLRKRHGFTASLGLRTPPARGVYASGFAGVTSDAEANHLTVFDRRTFMPHVGLMVGYELSPVR